MSESGPIWCITFAGRYADLIRTMYDALSKRLPPKLAHDVTLEYARVSLAGGQTVYESEREDEE